jgi:hypothetical protein
VWQPSLKTPPLRREMPDAAQLHYWGARSVSNNLFVPLIGGGSKW